MKKIPRVLAEKIARIQSDALYEDLREKLCSTSCSADADSSPIACEDCIIMSGDSIAKTEFREYLTRYGVNLSVVRSL